jgi:serine/threonine protein phosphatase 1
MRLLAIGDVHGCSKAFDALWEAAAPRAGDEVVALGDFVDRGPDSRGVLDRLIKLHRAGKVIPLRGNHDWMMQRALEEPFVDPGWLEVGGRESVESYGGSLAGVPPAHREFLANGLLDWYETDGHIFVHASVYPDLDLADQPTYMLHWEKIDEWTPAHKSGKVVVCGHTSQKGGRPLNIGHLVCIDTYCYGGGWLTCLEVGRGRYWQANERGEVREGRLDDVT